MDLLESSGVPCCQLAEQYQICPTGRMGDDSDISQLVTEFGMADSLMEAMARLTLISGRPQPGTLQAAEEPGQGRSRHARCPESSACCSQASCYMQYQSLTWLCWGPLDLELRLRASAVPGRQQGVRRLLLPVTSVRGLVPTLCLPSSLASRRQLLPAQLSGVEQWAASCLCGVRLLLLTGVMVCRATSTGGASDQSAPSGVEAAVEAAIAPLKLNQPAIACNYGTAVSMMDQALAPVMTAYTKAAVKRYLWGNVHYCLHDGTFHDTQRKLKEYIRSGKCQSKHEAKQYQHAKLLLRQLHGRP